MIQEDTEGVSASTVRHVDPLSAELLQSVVDVARAIFGAQASSVFLLDEEAGELVFESVSGRGEDFLIGRRFPATAGIAGWVVATGEALVVDDLADNAVFDRDAAESTRYVPDALMAAPLVHGETVLGVLEVLDPVPQSRASLQDLDLLSMFARQAAAALRVVVDRHPDGDGDRGALAHLPREERAAALDLMRDLHRLLESPAL